LVTQLQFIQKLIHNRFPMDGTLAGAWVTLCLALSFFIFFAKRLPFIILCTTCGMEIMQFERFFDCTDKLKLFFYFFEKKKLYEAVKTLSLV